MAHRMVPTTLGAPLEAWVQDSPAAAPAGGAPADGLMTPLKAVVGALVTSVLCGIAIALFSTTGFTVPTSVELESMKPEEKEDRMQYWVAVLGCTYIAIVVVGTVVMYMGSRVAGKMMRIRCESRDERLQLGVMVMFLPYYILLTSLTAWCASTERLSHSTGLPWEIYWLVLLSLSVAFLMQALLAVALKSSSSTYIYIYIYIYIYGLEAFGQATLFTVMPFISDAFDTLKDVVFGGLCMVNEHVVIKVLGAFSRMWLLIVHVGLLRREDTSMQLVGTYLSIYMASFDAGKNDDLFQTMTRTPWNAAVSILFKQTTQDKVVLIMYEDMPQTIMAAAYWFLSPSKSSFVVIFNIMLPILRITFAAVAYDRLRKLAQPGLRDDLRTATMAGNEVKESYVMKHIFGGKMEALAKAQGGRVDGDTMDLSNTGITDRHWRILEALRHNTSLKTIGLGGNNIGDVRATALAEALRQNSILKKIYLGGNSIGDEGAKALAEALRKNKTLQVITLRDNNIGPEGAKELAEALRHNTALETMVLNSNEIGDAGATALAEALRHNTSLKTIGLGGNNIGDVGATALAEALRHNTALETMVLNFNEIGDAGATALAEALKVNESLTKIYLNSNKIGDDGAKALAEAKRDGLKIYGQTGALI